MFKWLKITAQNKIPYLFKCFGNLIIKNGRPDYGFLFPDTFYFFPDINDKYQWPIMVSSESPLGFSRRVNMCQLLFPARPAEGTAGLEVGSKHKFSKQVLLLT